MTTFTSPIPDKFLEDPGVAEWARDLTLFINDLVAPDGVIATGEATTAVVLTQQEKLDLIAVTQSVDLDDMEADTATNKTAVDLIATGSPAYIITNDTTKRVMDADAAAGTISATYQQAEVENIRDAQLNSDDVLATLQKDLKAKGILG
jgi:hypothetical protein